MTPDEFKALLNDALAEQEQRFDKKLEQNNAVLFGQLTTYFDKRFTELRDELKGEIDELRTIMDGIAKRLETDDQERAAMTNQLDRHDTWIHQLADTTHTKLATE